MSEYSAQERQQLLQLARQSIAAHLRREPLPEPDLPEHLRQPRGAFCTLHLQGKLRGCIGYVEPLFPLWQTVMRTAIAAATEDPRFAPLTMAELPHIQIELSVMSPLRPISHQEIEVGVHGLMISQGGRRGLLLPQVATEWGFDRETFLTETCHKAGLRRDAWQHGATIEAFTAEVFGEAQHSR
ncbi:MAG TPA: AmmeMemoRadiSam system protein A [Candidatus Acidoferrales bacterium]|nr:AmmeMemoRadiSam system protein A [Candidatus Acidoferrales bacterium]